MKCQGSGRAVPWVGLEPWSGTSRFEYVCPSCPRTWDRRFPFAPEGRAIVPVHEAAAYATAGRVLAVGGAPHEGQAR